MPELKISLQLPKTALIVAIQSATSLRVNLFKNPISEAWVYQTFQIFFHSIKKAAID